jgi:hypothetical protein
MDGEDLSQQLLVAGAHDDEARPWAGDVDAEGATVLAEVHLDDVARGDLALLGAVEPGPEPQGHHRPERRPARAAAILRGRHVSTAAASATSSGGISASPAWAGSFWQSWAA